MAWHGYNRYSRYISVDERRAIAVVEMDKLREQGQTIEPVKIQGRQIARSFWGKSWCEHLESFSDFENRLPRGRTCARNGSVCHLEIESGRIKAIVSGSQLYEINIRVTKLQNAQWLKIKQRCAGQIGSMLELLQGKLSDQVMTLVTDRQNGLFPTLDQVNLGCSCPDWAMMCKHVAGVLYGVGHRLDDQPHLLFTLRGVDPQELITADLALPGDRPTGAQTLAGDQLSDIFGIDLDSETEPDQPSADSDVVPADPPKAKVKAKGNVRSSTAVLVPRASPSSRRSKKRTSKRKAATAKAVRWTEIQKPQKSQRQRQPNKAAVAPVTAPTGKSIIRLRRRSGLTQLQFAQKLGVSGASVARWEATSGRLNLQRRCVESLAGLKVQLQGK